MPRKRFTNEQIAFALRQSESGTMVEEISRLMAVKAGGGDAEPCWRRARYA